MKLIWSDEAEADLDAIVEYIAHDDVMAALNTEDRIRAAGDRLLEMPRMGRAGRVPGTLELVVSRTSHFLVYGIDGDVIHIYHVTHGARQWPPAEQ